MYRDEGKINKTKLEADDGSENHSVSVRSTLIEEKLNSKSEAGHNEQTDDCVQDALGQVDKFEVGHKKETEEAVHAQN